MFVRSATVFLTLVLATGTAAAQGNAPPSRIGNVYNGTAHEPNPATVQGNESAAGVAAPSSQQKANDKSLQNLNRQIQTNGEQTINKDKSLACSTVPASCR